MKNIAIDDSTLELHIQISGKNSVMLSLALRDGSTAHKSIWKCCQTGVSKA